MVAQAERYGLKTESYSGTIIKYPACCTCCDVEIDLKRVVITWTTTAHPYVPPHSSLRFIVVVVVVVNWCMRVSSGDANDTRPSELIGDMYFALKGKRSQLDTSDRKGAYRHVANRYKPVWEKRRLQTNNGDEYAEAETALTTAFNSEFPLEVRSAHSCFLGYKAWCLTALASSAQLLLAIFAFLLCNDLVCAGLVCKEVRPPLPSPVLCWPCVMRCVCRVSHTVERGVAGAVALAHAVHGQVARSGGARRTRERRMPEGDEEGQKRG